MEGSSRLDRKYGTNECSELIQAVLRQVWEEFYAWEQPASRTAINSLLRNPAKHTEGTTTPPPLDLDNEVLSAFSEWSLDSHPETLQFIDYPEADSITTHIPTYTIELPVFQSHDAYEGSAPLSRNIHVGDDPDNMPFLPFADDPSFDFIDHQTAYKYLSWQDLPDPDLQVIVMETIHRLHTTYNLSLEQIESTGTLPISLFPTINSPGLLHMSKLRDWPAWPQLTLNSNLPLSAFGPPKAEDLYDRVTKSLRNFCPNLNCIDPYCYVHIEMNPMPPPKLPPFDNADEPTQKAPCGPHCFQLLREKENEAESWTAEESNELRTILQLCGDVPPCDLAILCLKPCYQVSTEKLRIMQEIERPVETDLASRYFSNAPPKKELKPDRNRLPPPPKEPCRHSGPCDQFYLTSTGHSLEHCHCAFNNTRCQRNCQCPTTCKNRWKGCDCHNGRRTAVCGSDSCVCRRAGRECDPEICLSCNARDQTHPCQNAHIQRGLSKRTLAKKSGMGYGMGLFLDEPAKIGDYISEYIGELIYEPTVDSRDDVARHRGRTYLFGLNEGVSVDSSLAGNEMRYINHSKKANCRAQMKLVNGEQRIGIYACRNIAKGVELSLDYGPKFFDR
ncbi:hypothetical protein JAAARDRAFT_161438 [Jaapia argillacea MUCL 33604]|uniref:SET domain-containing protein n=1 Tax=Jaapia argillacea MUCL 33604 TaxID=933084 RepID=A0A067PFR0_9AGAM|nr:hypothetical protein JAAARDRAFT_161438 [Jaapia argillacea MUCL 33604]